MAFRVISRFVSGLRTTFEIRGSVIVQPAIVDAARLMAEIANESERRLRDMVPVRTGLMRRRVDARGALSQIEIYSDAMNNRGIEYAQYVRRYDKALVRVVGYAVRRVSTERVRTIRRLFFGGVNVEYERASDYISVRRNGTRLELRLR